MWVTIAQFILSLSILIVLHELGHFSAAKWFKTRVEKFYLFFNPGFSLFKVQKGETEYGIGWLPLGGYVKISGMIDESFDSEQMKGEPQPWEFRSKPAWQRLIIMVGGVFVNFVLGIFLFSMVNFIWGKDFLPAKNVTEGISVTDKGYEMGLRDDDKILKIGDKVFDQFNPKILNKEIIFNEATQIEVLRNGSKKMVTIDSKYGQELSKYENRSVQMFHPKFPAEIFQFDKKSPADPQSAGLKVGDQIIAINGKPTPYLHTAIKAIKDTLAPEQTNMTVLRGQDTVSVTYLTSYPKKKSLFQRLFNRDPGKSTRLGFDMSSEAKFFEYENQKFGLGAACAAGWSESWGFLGDQMKAFGQMFKGKIKAKDSLGSFITIGKLFGKDWNWKRFWSMTAMLSILLGFFNLLPIPALDGGYVMFLLWESITGIKVPDSIMEKATFIGFLLLMGLMIYAFGLDIYRQF